MTIGPAMQRYVRMMIALLAVSISTGAWNVALADDETPPSSQQQPAATAPGSAPGGQKGGGRRGGDAANASPAAEQHRLPPDSTTKQTLALPGRTLNFTATAGSIRIFNDKGEPQGVIAFTAYQLDGADGRNRPVAFLFNGGPGAVPGRAEIRQRRPLL